MRILIKLNTQNYIQPFVSTNLPTVVDRHLKWVHDVTRNFCFFFPSARVQCERAMLNKPAKVQQKKLVGTDVMYTFVFIGNLEYISLSLLTLVCLPFFSLHAALCLTAVLPDHQLFSQSGFSHRQISVKVSWCRPSALHFGLGPVININRPLGHERLDLLSELPQIFQLSRSKVHFNLSMGLHVSQFDQQYHREYFFFLFWIQI